MSEAEVSSVIGVLDGITEKPTGWTHIAVIPDGAQRALILATKLQPLIELARAAGPGRMLWTFKEQDGKNINPHTNEPYKDRYFEKVAPLDGSEPAGSVATPDAPAQVGAYSNTTPMPKPAGDSMSKEEWARKDSAIHKMACIKTAAAALTHTVPSDPTPEELAKFLERVFTLTYSWHQNVIAERDDPTGEQVPFA